MGPYQAVPARSSIESLQTSVEVSSGGLAGSSFTGSLVNLFPAGRVELKMAALQPDVVPHTCNPNIQEPEVGGLL